MFAIVAETVIAPGQHAAYEAALEEYLQLRARQPGDQGYLRIAADEDRELLLALWESVEQSTSAHATVLTPAGARLLHPVLAAPLKVLGAGEVTWDNLSDAARNGHTGWAAIGIASIDPGQRDSFAVQYAEFMRGRATLAGFRGNVDVAIGENRVLTLIVWDSIEAHNAVQPQLSAISSSLPRHYAAPMELLGMGPIRRDAIGGHQEGSAA